MTELTSAQWLLEANKILTGASLIEYGISKQGNSFDYRFTFLLNTQNPYVEIRTIACRGIAVKKYTTKDTRTEKEKSTDKLRIGPSFIYYDLDDASNDLLPQGGTNKIIKFKERFILPEKINNEQVWRVQLTLEFEDLEIEINSPQSALIEL